MLTTVRSYVRDSCGSNFTFYLDYFLFLSSLRTFIALKILIWNAFVSSNQLAQSIERGANKGKVLCSILKEQKSKRAKEQKSKRAKEQKSKRFKVNMV